MEEIRRGSRLYPGHSWGTVSRASRGCRCPHGGHGLSKRASPRAREESQKPHGGRSSRHIDEGHRGSPEHPLRHESLGGGSCLDVPPSRSACSRTASLRGRPGSLALQIAGLARSSRIALLLSEAVRPLGGPLHHGGGEAEARRWSDPPDAGPEGERDVRELLLEDDRRSPCTRRERHLFHERGGRPSCPTPSDGPLCGLLL